MTIPSDTDESRILPAWAWAWLPIGLVAGVLAWRIVDESSYRAHFENELGFAENGTAVLLIPGIYAALIVWRLRERLPFRLLGFWYGLVGLGCVYFAGEELSWGQSLFHWETPELLERVNDQGETNIHNISSWFDQKPRLLLELWVLFGGVLFHVWSKATGRRCPPGHWAYWFWPARQLIPVSVLALIVMMPKRILESFGSLPPPPFDIRETELQEYLFAVFLTLYLWSVLTRLRATSS
ncbi:MAG: hypothetical protein CL569_06700 [Alphaproteobacteria bacterium]|nr:hypothetical protein [Alphaproteobacteria bacterium]|tara:strand:+ start:1010 stop:1726 length:717 start_codon:yes stop_codon:yes gene_type:complete